MSQILESTARLANFPVAFFAVVMGLAGLSIGWEKAEAVMQLELGFVPWLIELTVLLFSIFAALYGLKLILHREAVQAELTHPVRLNFFPTISISLLLLAIALLPMRPSIGHAVWIIGALTQLGFTLYIVSVWMHGRHLQVHHLSPAWFFPAVGNVLVPIAGVPLGYVDISWFFFSVGVLLWSVLMTIVFYRVLFHHPLDERLMPTLFILVAPPAAGFIAYLQLTGGLDVYANALFFTGLFLAALLFSQIGRFLRLGFFLTWWAYSFPLAALSIACLTMFEATGTALYRYLGMGLLMMVSGIILFLGAATAIAAWHRRICVIEPISPLTPGTPSVSPRPATGVGQ